MANTDKYIANLKAGNPDLFIIKKLDPDSGDPTDYIDYDSEPESALALSKIFDLVGKHTSIITTNTSFEQKNAAYLVKGDCTITMPLGFDGLEISIRIFSGTTITINPYSGDKIEESASAVVLTAGDTRRYIFINNSWYGF